MAIKIKSQTDTQLVITSNPNYFMGAFGLLIIGLVWANLPYGPVVPEILLVAAGTFSVVFFLVYSKLTADKNTGNITIVRRYLGLYVRRQEVPINTVIAVDCDYQFGPSSRMVRLSLQIRDSNEILFGIARAHYANGIKDWFNIDAEYREQQIATQTEKFLGVYIPDK